MITRIKRRRKKCEEDLKTKYYYRRGVLRVIPIANSPLGFYDGEFVSILKYSRDRHMFLFQDRDGRMGWTDKVVHVRPEVNGHELYYTSFPLLIQQNYKEGTKVMFRTKNSFAYLRKDIRKTEEGDYHICTCGVFNDHIPKGYNFCLGYSDNNAITNPSIIDRVDFRNTLYNVVNKVYDDG